MEVKRLSVVLGLWLGVFVFLLPACKPRRSIPAEPSEASLRPYDFRGHTRLKLGRLCEGASLLEGGPAARRHLRCARVLLDWFLMSVLREDSELLADLEVFVGLAKASVDEGTRGVRLLEAIGGRFRRAVAEGSGGSITRAAEAGLALVELQRQESSRWGYDYLKGLGEASRVGAPFEAQARVIIAGASLDGLKTMGKAPPHLRALVLVQGLGFACPAEAEMARDPEKAGEQSPSCPMVCTELAGRLQQMAPEKRKGLIAARCPLKHLGLWHRDHGVYLSEENLLVTRSLAFQIENLQRLKSLAGKDALVEALDGALGTLERRLGEVRVPLSLPELSPGEAIHFPLPLCPSAEEPVTAPVVLALDETRLFVGTLPVAAVHNREVTFLDWREGLLFPGRSLEVADPATLLQELRQLRGLYRRILGSEAPLSEDRVAIYAASSLSAGRLGDLLDVLVEIGVRRVELVLRNAQGLVRGVTVDLALRRRGEGPPISQSELEAKPSPEKAPLELVLSRGRMHLKAAQGPLATSPLSASAGDLAGLRETLEKTRRDYRDVAGVEIRTDHAVSYADLARLLHHLRRNSSGRPLYSSLIL